MYKSTYKTSRTMLNKAICVSNLPNTGANTCEKMSKPNQMGYDAAYLCSKPLKWNSVTPSMTGQLFGPVHA